jgi:opacity protein-like surface antigen
MDINGYVQLLNNRLKVLNQYFSIHSHAINSYQLNTHKLHEFLYLFDQAFPSITYMPYQLNSSDVNRVVKMLYNHLISRFNVQLRNHYFGNRILEYEDRLRSTSGYHATENSNSTYGPIWYS